MLRSPTSARRPSSAPFAAALVTGWSALAPAAAFAQAIEQSSLTPPGATGHEFFGHAIAADGDLMVVGGPGETGYSVSAGEAWVYRFDPLTAAWQFETSLASSTPELSGAFGHRVAIHGDVIAVTSRYEDAATAVDCGAVHLFRGGRAVGGTWVHQQKLTAANPAFLDAFGEALALHDDVLLVGAPFTDTAVGPDAGQVHAFEYDSVGQVWNETTQLVDPGSYSYDHAGSSLAFDGTTAMVGIPGKAHVPGPQNVGSVLVWSYGTFGWTYSLELRAAVPQSERFGSALAFDGVDLIVGAPSHTGAGFQNCGAVHFLTLRNGLWQPSGTHVNPDPWYFEAFGGTVALKGKVALAATGRMNEAYSYRKGRFNKGWFLDQELGGSDKAIDNYYGNGLAISDERVMVGAPWHGGTYKGKVYVFDSDEINLSITPLQPQPGETISLSVYDGLPGDPVLVAVDELDGVPAWIPIGVFAFGSNHRFELDADAEDPLFGIAVGIRAWKISPTEPVVATERVVVDM